MLTARPNQYAPDLTKKRLYKTFDSSFENGVNYDLWPEATYPWIEEDENIGQQIVINEEHQYYVAKSDVIIHHDYRPSFINDYGNLVLRCIPTPSEYRHLACGLLDSYSIINVDCKQRRITIKGNCWLDPMTGIHYTGINRYLRSDLTNTGYGFVCIGKNPKRLMYRRIHERAVDPLYTSGINTTHTFELIDDIPDSDRIITGETELSLLRHLPFISGGISTRGAFSQIYGRWHVRLRFPQGRGTFASASTWPNYSHQDRHSLPLVDRSCGISLLEQPGHHHTQYHRIYKPSLVENNVCEADLPNSFIHPDNQNSRNWYHKVERNEIVNNDMVSAHEWCEVIWDWYPDNTCAWFIKCKDRFIETARTTVPVNSPSGSTLPRCIVLSNAFNSYLNRSCEIADQTSDGLIGFLKPPPWDLEVDYVRVSQWEGYPPFMGALPAEVNNLRFRVA